MSSQSNRRRQQAWSRVMSIFFSVYQQRRSDNALHGFIRRNFIGPQTSTGFRISILERSNERDLLRSVVKYKQRKVMELKLGADLNAIE